MMIIFSVFSSLISALLCGLWLRKTRYIKIITLISLIITLIISFYCLIQVCSGVEISPVHLMSWSFDKNFVVHWNIYFDVLSSTMLVMVSLISLIIHIYSFDYMETDRNIHKFICFLSLFTFFMLFFVTSRDLLQLFFCWEGIGLFSFLLISYWYEKKIAVNSAFKAFIINRVADIGLVVAMVLLYYFVGSWNSSILFQKINILSSKYILGLPVVELVALSLFIAAMGKSAQIFFHVWLPDAMVAPTPVSALIHSATMVTAGVYLILVFNPIFKLSPITNTIIVFISLLTILITGYLASVVFDIKRIIAYSTCSQLGFMFLVAGIGAYSVSFYHLFCHAFFKSLLFLCAGIIIKYTGEQDISKMPDLRKQQPLTFIMVIIGILSLSGFPLTIGFYSKEYILSSLYFYGSIYLYPFILLAFLITNFYGLRFLFMLFFNSKDTKYEKHKIKFTNMYNCILFLGVFSVMLGFISNYFLVEKLNNFFQDINPQHYIEIFLQSMLIFGLAVLIILFTPVRKVIMSFLIKGKKVVILDGLYNRYIVHPIKSLGNFFYSKVDYNFIDYFGPRFVSNQIYNYASIISRRYTGLISDYVYYIIIGFVILLIFLLWGAL